MKDRELHGFCKTWSPDEVYRATGGDPEKIIEEIESRMWKCFSCKEKFYHEDTKIIVVGAVLHVEQNCCDKCSITLSTNYHFKGVTNGR